MQLFRSTAGLIALCAILATSCSVEQTSNLKSDEEVLFFPGMAHRVEDGWEISIHGLVLEPEGRGATVALLRQALGLGGIDRTAEEEVIFARRARYFLADHERNKRIVIRLGNRPIKLDKTRADGFFAGIVSIDDADVRNLPGARDGRIQFQAVLPRGDRRVFAGDIYLHDRSGLTVISDLDDTIKVTNVRDRGATLRNTFLREFEAVPGMAELYRDWSESAGAQFVYLSASPWQLFDPLNELIRSNQFPDGAFHLKTFRWKDERFLSLFMNPEDYKFGAIEPIMERFPERRFVLVGDSGERDPEIYAALARKYPRQVQRIFIRDVTEESAGSARYRQTFTNLPPVLWKIFSDPSELPRGGNW